MPYLHLTSQWPSKRVWLSTHPMWMQITLLSLVIERIDEQANNQAHDSTNSAEWKSSSLGAKEVWNGHVWNNTLHFFNFILPNVFKHKSYKILFMFIRNIRLDPEFLVLLKV